MELSPSIRRKQQRHYNRLAKRRQRFAKRLRFLLLGLKLIHPFGLPLENLAIALIQECISQMWPEPEPTACSGAAYSRRRGLAVSPSTQPGNTRRLTSS
jgi:hypothetical protein